MIVTGAFIANGLMAIALMAVAMLAAAIGGRWWVGVLAGLVAGMALILLARALGRAPVLHPFATAVTVAVASVSFAARGMLFSTAYPRKGWLLALFVVVGEAAILATAAYLPAWLLFLLPAQWASTVLQGALFGAAMGTPAAVSALIALGGTAVTTLLVVRLWPRRWPYALMFSAWLGLSALVWQASAATPTAHAYRHARFNDADFNANKTGTNHFPTRTRLDTLRAEPLCSPLF